MEKSKLAGFGASETHNDLPNIHLKYICFKVVTCKVRWYYFFQISQLNNVVVLFFFFFI